MSFINILSGPGPPPKNVYGNYYSIYIKFKKRNNKYMFLEVMIVVTLKRSIFQGGNKGVSGVLVLSTS